MTGLDVLYARFGHMDPAPASAADTVAVWPHFVQKDPGLLEKLPGGLVVFVFRGTDIEYWRYDLMEGDVTPIDVLVRSVARYGGAASAVLVARTEMIGNWEGLRIVVTAEHGGQRAELTQDLVAATGIVGRLVPRDLGPVEGDTWTGEGPVVPLTAVGYPALWEGAGEA